MSHIPELLQTWGNNFTRNTSNAFKNLSPQDLIRLVMIIGAYMLIIRPVLVAIGVKIQSKQHADASKEFDGNAKLDADHVKSRIRIPGVESDSESEDDEAKANIKSGQWGRIARIRQRDLIRRVIKNQEVRNCGDESDEEIRHLLQD